MRMKTYKRRKLFYCIIRKVSSLIQWIGILALLGTIVRIELGMSAVHAEEYLLIEAAVILAAFITHSLFCYAEWTCITYTGRFNKRTRK